MLTATQLYTISTRDFSKTLANTAKEKVVSNDTAYFTANIGKVKSVSDLMNNSRLYDFVLKAYGLSDMGNEKALIAKALGGGTATGSLASTLNNGSLKALVSDFNFASTGASTTSSKTLPQKVVNNYVQQTVLANIGDQNAGAKMALYFQTQASSITSAYGILADKTLLSVFETATGLSSKMSSIDIDLQAKIIGQKLDISKLQDPAYVQKFAEQFTAMYDMQNSSSEDDTTPTNALLAQSSGISSDLLLSIATLRSGGV